MALSTQYYNGTDYTQFGLDVADYTISSVVCDTFHCIKDSQDTIYIYCSKTGTNVFRKIIKITSTGVKTVTQSTTGLHSNAKVSLCLSRDESRLYFIDNPTSTLAQSRLQYVSVSDLTGSNYTPVEGLTNGTTYADSFNLYQDRYIWVASGTTVKIYDYTTKVSLDPNGSVASFAEVGSMDIGGENILYSLSRDSTDPSWSTAGLYKSVFNGTDTITSTQLVADVIAYPRQLLLDKYGNLIILTNYGTASTLLKYTTAGVQVGTTLSLGGAFYNLNTDKDGNYYYSNALGTYKITANTTQGEAFTGVGTKIRGSGMTTYGSNITGYAPAVFGEQ